MAAGYIEYSNQIIAIIGIVITIIIALIGWKLSRSHRAGRFNASNGSSVQFQQVEKANNVIQVNFTGSGELQKPKIEVSKGKMIIGDKAKKRDKKIGKPTDELVEFVKANIFQSQEPLSDLLSKSIEIAKRLDKKDDLYWLERELYGAEEWSSKKGTEARSTSDKRLFPDYRTVKAKVTVDFVLSGGRHEVKEYEFNFFLGMSTIEIERIVKDAGNLTQLLMRTTLPEDWVKLAKKHDLNFERQEKVPYIIDVADLKRILEQIRLRVHKFVSSL